jgi:hypothetical protein
VLNRPEGRWRSVGILEASAARMNPSVMNNRQDVKGLSFTHSSLSLKPHLQGVDDDKHHLSNPYRD